MIGTLLVRYPGSGALHYVDVSDEGPLPPVDQLKLLTPFDPVACGVAAAESLGRKRGRTIPSDPTILWDEGNTGKGASIQGVVNGLAAMGLHSVVESITPEGPLDVMNPWGGVDVAPPQSEIWLNAAAVGWPGGWFIRVTDPPAGELEMDNETALGLARIALPLILGHAPSMDEVNKVAGDIVASGLASALDHFEAEAASGGEISLTQRVQNIESGHPSPPA